MKWIDKKIGREFKTKDTLMFFGNKKGSLEAIQKLYPQFEFRFLNQVHGNNCLLSGKAEVEADAHYTSETEIALCIRTADCTPILCATDSTVLAIHAGWRGVFHEILTRSFAVALGSTKPLIAMGPHIQKQSFEVDLLLGNQFSEKFGSEFVSRKKSVPNKCFVDLNGVLRHQLQQSGVQPKDLWCSKEDTLSDESYFSHRRDPQNKGRNISFVARL